MSKRTGTPSAASIVAEKIKSMLSSGEIAEGEKLPGEFKLAEQLGIGRSTLREALKLLSASGYIEIIPNRGAFAVVTGHDELPGVRHEIISWLDKNRNSVSEMLELRACIEPFAAERAALNISERQLEELGEIMDSFGEATINGDTERLPMLDFKFHRLIIKASGNELLETMCGSLLKSFIEYSSYTNAMIGKGISSTYNEHKAVFDAISASSPAEARAAMSLHIAIASRRHG